MVAVFLIFFVEEPSAQAALNELVPRILSGRADWDFDVIVFQGKQNMLKKLSSRLKAYAHQHTAATRLVVLVDRDNDDCVELKATLEDFAREAGWPTKTAPGTDGQYMLVNRVACEELEAWFFGDVEAVRAAYPASKVPKTLADKSGYRDPDAIKGGTWEALERLLQADHPGGLEKVRAASEISAHMNPDRNRSRSFQVFRDAVRALVPAISTAAIDERAIGDNG